MSKIIFVADFFKGDTLGGAELHDDVVLQYFKSNDLLYDYKRSQDLTEQYLRENTDKTWFIGNFVGIQAEHKAYLADNCEYLLYEHDYKFCKIRNPITFPNFICPPQQLTNLNFYFRAKKVICLSKMHRGIFERNLALNNLVNVNCSMWPDEDLTVITKLEEELRGNKKNKFAIINSPNPIKKTRETVAFCDNNNIEYDLISSPDHHSFLKTLANYKGLIFQTGHPEPTPRVAIEAKMLGCKFMSQKELIGVAHEDYFGLSGVNMIEEVRRMRDKALRDIVGWVNE
jgi:hypothetical protein